MSLLLVEDSGNDAMLLLRWVRRGGYEPVHERAGLTGPRAQGMRLERGLGLRESFEAVLSGYYMPRSYGFRSQALWQRADLLARPQCGQV